MLAKSCTFCGWPDDHHNPACPNVGGATPSPPSPAPSRPHIEATLQERGARYGNFSVQSEIAQALKDVMRATPGWNKLAPDQKEALDMEANKNARILNGDPNFHDSWHDKVGYNKLIADRLAVA